MRQKAPRLSASAAKRTNECPSSFTRSQEFFQFLEKHDIDGHASDPTTDRGTHIHLICSKVPIQCDGLTSEPIRDYREIVDELYQSLLASGEVGKLSGFERYICAVFTANRDLFIEQVVQAHPLFADPSVQLDIEINLDDKRLILPFRSNGEPYGLKEAWPIVGDPLTDNLVRSGLPDVHVVVRGGGQSVVGILDYKSGQQEYDPSDNPQIDDLLGLASFTEEREHGVAPVAGLGAFAYEADLKGDLRIARFNVADLDVIRTRIIATSKPAILLSERFRTEGGGTPSDGLAYDLDKAAKVHGHCTYCDGKLCCGAFRISMAQAEYALSYKYKESLNQNNFQNPDGTVNTKSVSEVLHLSAAFTPLISTYVKAQESAEELARQLALKGVVVPDVTVTAGRKRTVLNGESLQEIMPKIASITGDDITTVLDLVPVKVSTSELKAYLEGKVGKKGKELASYLESLGMNSPVMTTYCSPVVTPTGPQEDVIQEVAQEVQARHKALEELRAKAAAATAGTPAVSSAPAAPAPAPAPAPVPVPAPSVAPVVPPVLGAPMAGVLPVSSEPAAAEAPAASVVLPVPVRRPRKPRKTAEAAPSAPPIEVPIPQDDEESPSLSASVSAPSVLGNWM